MTTHHTLGSVAVPRGMVWVDEFDWVPVERAVTYSLTGALLVDVAPRLAGRPITLAASDDRGWSGMTRDKLITLRAKAAFDNAQARLWPGQLVTIKIQTGLDKDALAVPPTVVQRGLDSHFVYRVNGDKVEVVPVQVTYQNSDVNIIKGVQAGDVLVSDGQSRLKSGSRVEVLSGPTAARVQP